MHHHLDLASQLSFTATPKIGLRSYFSATFLGAALNFRDLAINIEKMHSHQPGDPHSQTHKQYVVSTIVSSVSFLESMINELLVDAHERHGTSSPDAYISPLSNESIDNLSRYWDETNKGMAEILDKFRATAQGCGTTLNTSGQSYEAVKLLIMLRNELMHYKPATIYTDEVHKLEKRLSKKFAINNILPVPSGNPWWPDKALGAGCASWAVNSVIEFTDSFSEDLGIVPNYQRVLFGKRPH